MRIAHICQSYPPMVSGAALAAERLASSMVDRGHDVLVVAASERRRAYVDRNNGVSLVRVRSLRNPVRSGQCFSLLPLREVSAALRSFAPDLVHLHDPLCLGLCGLRAARVHHLPLVFTAHSLPQIVSRSLPDLPVLRQTVERMLWSYARWFAGQCDVVITPSQTAAGALRARIGGDPLVIGNVVDRERFSPTPQVPGEREALCEKYGLDPTLPVILYVGRVDVEKRVDLVVQAAARAMHSVETQLLVVGDGKRLPEIVRICENLAMSDRSCFPGFVAADGDMPGLYRLASVFCTACEIEAQGIVVLEAAATELPVIAVRSGAVPEAVADGVNGYLVPPGDAEAMAERLVALLSDPERAAGLGRAGRVVAERHTVAKAMDAYEQLYLRQCPRSPTVCAKPREQIQ